MCAQAALSNWSARLVKVRLPPSPFASTCAATMPIPWKKHWLKLHQKHNIYESPRISRGKSGSSGTNFILCPNYHFSPLKFAVTPNLSEKSQELWRPQETLLQTQIDPSAAEPLVGARCNYLLLTSSYSNPLLFKKLVATSVTLMPPTT